MNKKIIGVLVAIIIILVAALAAVVLPDSNKQMDNTKTNATESNEKWVLVYEKNVDPITLETLFDNRYEYEYDTDGELVKIYTDNIEITDFVYDDKGNIISKKESNKVLDSEAVYYYEYDEHNNIVKEVKEKISGFTSSFTDYHETIYSLSYENGICTEAKATINHDKETLTAVQTTSDGRTYYNCIDKYEYDENGNLYSVASYSLNTDAEDVVTLNGFDYGLKSITYYSYEKRSVVVSNVEKESNSQHNITLTTTEPTTTSKKLSDECTEVLATGTNSNGDYYEVVANKVEDYTGLSVYVGVIKNNEWLLEPTKDMPFVSEENTFNSNGPEAGEITYVGNDCFVAMKKSKGGSVSALASYAYMYIAYNVETGKSYSTANYKWNFLNEIPLICREEDEHMIIGYDGYAGVTVFHILNKRDMTVSDVRIEGYRNSFANISEGVFSVALGESNYPKHYIYDINGKIVLDLSEYKTYGHQNVYFTDGKCNLEIINNNDTKYRLTINKKGEVIDSEEIYE